MENLLNPDSGLIIWTIVSFTCLVLLLGKVAWKPLLRALEERESGIRQAVDEAQKARADAEALKGQYERTLAGAQDSATKMLAQARAESETLRADVVRKAEEEARRLLDQAKRQMEEEKHKLSRELRQDVAGLSIRVAETLMRQAMNAKEQERLVQETLKDLENDAGVSRS